MSGRLRNDALITRQAGQILPRDTDFVFLHQSEIDERVEHAEGFSGPLQRAFILHRYELEYFPHSGQPEHFRGSEFPSRRDGSAIVVASCSKPRVNDSAIELREIQSFIKTHGG